MNCQHKAPGWNWQTSKPYLSIVSHCTVELNTRSNGMQWLAIQLKCANREGRYTLRPSQDIFMIIAGSITSGKREISFPLTARLCVTVPAHARWLIQCLSSNYVIRWMLCGNDILLLSAGFFRDLHGIIIDEYNETSRSNFRNDDSTCRGFCSEGQSSLQ